jgi:hypothetical protein
MASRVNICIALPFLDRGIRRGWVVKARPNRTLPPGKTRYPLYRRLGGPQGQSGRAENLAQPGLDPRTVQPVVSRYTDWATGPTWYMGTFRKFVAKIQVSLKSYKNIGFFTWRLIYVLFWSYLAEFFSEREKFHKKLWRKSKCILCSINVFRKWYRLWDNVEKYCRCGQVTVRNMAHVHFMMDT